MLGRSSPLHSHAQSQHQQPGFHLLHVFCFECFVLFCFCHWRVFHEFQSINGLVYLATSVGFMTTISYMCHCKTRLKEKLSAPLESHLCRSEGNLWGFSFSFCKVIQLCHDSLEGPPASQTTPYPLSNSVISKSLKLTNTSKHDIISLGFILDLHQFIPFVINHCDQLIRPITLDAIQWHNFDFDRF